MSHTSAITLSNQDFLFGQYALDFVALNHFLLGQHCIRVSAQGQRKANRAEITFHGIQFARVLAFLGSKHRSDYCAVVRKNTGLLTTR